jgi:hypothetical protein
VVCFVGTATLEEAPAAVRVSVSTLEVELQVAELVRTPCGGYLEHDVLRGRDCGIWALQRKVTGEMATKRRRMGYKGDAGQYIEVPRLAGGN